MSGSMEDDKTLTTPATYRACWLSVNKALDRLRAFPSLVQGGPIKLFPSCPSVVHELRCNPNGPANHESQYASRTLNLWRVIRP
eukprot:10716944-Karenia_brevis.AAC.1